MRQDPIQFPVVSEQRRENHHAAALRAQHRIHLEDLLQAHRPRARRRADGLARRSLVSALKELEKKSLKPFNYSHSVDNSMNRLIEKVHVRGDRSQIMYTFERHRRLLPDATIGPDEVIQRLLNGQKVRITKRFLAEGTETTSRSYIQSHSDGGCDGDCSRKWETIENRGSESKKVSLHDDVLSKTEVASAETFALFVKQEQMGEVR